jgi:predicted nucleic acid-binding protein
MIAFDANILTGIGEGVAGFVSRANLIPAAEQYVPVIVVEEVLRGILNGIRLAEAGKGKLSLEQAYGYFERSVERVRRLRMLSYTAEADLHFQQWRKQKFRIATHDLRIAAICIAHNVTLVTRNRRDFEPIPNLSVEFWV